MKLNYLDCSDTRQVPPLSTSSIRYATDKMDDDMLYKAACCQTLDETERLVSSLGIQRNLSGGVRFQDDSEWQGLLHFFIINIG